MHVCAGTDGSDAELPAECAATPGKRECRTAGEGLSAENGNGRIPGTGGAGTPHGELETAGLTEIDYEGSTLEPAGYGERIILQIHGKLGGHYEIREKRVSTAKN